MFTYLKKPLFINIFVFASFLCSLLCGLLPSAADAATPASYDLTEDGLFGSREIKSRQLKAFKKWNGMLARNQREKEAPAADCRRPSGKPCMINDWRALLGFLQDKPVEEQIAEINIYMNRAPYITDIINWGVPDYWATLRQFMARDGDCEDYAIAKYLSLKELGVDVDNMRIVVVQDTNLDVPHAVLVVSLNGDRLVLDNQISYVVKEKAVLHYRPLYSINENAWWLHRM